MKSRAAIVLMAVALTGCDQLRYVGQEYDYTAGAAHLQSYIQLGCMYRSGNACVNAVKLAGNPDDDVPDEVVDRGIWWIDRNHGEPLIKIRWGTGSVVFIPAEKFSKAVRNLSDAGRFCLPGHGC